jgi:predicted glycosyl hydrolase (DUF1957 family)
MQYDQNVIKPITPSEYLNKFPINQIVSPAASSWGDKGYYEVWLNGSTIIFTDIYTRLQIECRSLPKNI